MFDTPLTNTGQRTCRNLVADHRTSKQHTSQYASLEEDWGIRDVKRGRTLDPLRTVCARYRYSLTPCRKMFDEPKRTQDVGRMQQYIKRRRSRRNGRLRRPLTTLTCKRHRQHNDEVLARENRNVGVNKKHTQLFAKRDDAEISTTVTIGRTDIPTMRHIFPIRRDRTRGYPADKVKI